MSSTCWKLFAVAVVCAWAVGCGGGTSSTSPSAPTSFLAGTWTATLAIEREGEPTTSLPITCTFNAVPDTILQMFQSTIRSQHPWLSITTTVTTAITPGNTPPARISTQGTY